MSQPFRQTPDGSVPACPDSSRSSPRYPPSPGDASLGHHCRQQLLGSVLEEAGWGMQSIVSPMRCSTPGDSDGGEGGRGPASARCIPGWGCQQAPGSRGGLGGCDYSIWSNPDLLTKAELFLKSNHSAKFASAARPAAAARRRGEIRPGKRGFWMPETGGRSVVPAPHPPGPLP